MKALSLRQPWPWIIFNLGKRIENRRWNTKFRGEFLIHAALGCTKSEWEAARDFCSGVGAWSLEYMVYGASPRGCIVGKATLVDVYTPEADDRGWHMRGQFGFVRSLRTHVGWTS